MAMGKSEIVSKIMDRIFPRGKSLHVLQCPIETSRTQWESAINELQRNTNRTTNESTNNHGLEITAARLARLTTISFSSIHTGDEGLLSSVEERFKQLDQFPHGTNE